MWRGRTLSLLLSSILIPSPDSHAPSFLSCERYDNLLEVDKLAAVISKVESVKLVLQENVQVALANCVTLENIEKAAGTFVLGLQGRGGGGVREGGAVG